MNHKQPESHRTSTRFSPYRLAAMFSLALALSGQTATAEGVGQSPDFRGPTGLQLYSLRDSFKKNGVPETLDLVRKWGFKYVELAGTYGLPPAEFKAELEKRGLMAVCGHFPYDKLKTDIDGVVREAKELGLKYVGCAWIVHQKPFDETQCRETAAVFNAAGKALAENNIRFYYHNHGYEFHPHGDGTLFDLLVAETHPDFVSFQMDVLWTVLPAQDPVKLLKKYPGRWLLFHLKDLRKGVPTGTLEGKTDLVNDVALGTGQMDWAAILKTAQECGVKYYFIEDESPTATEQIPQSLKFLEQLNL